MISDFFDHKCNIFHLRSEGKSPGFGLPSSPSHSYPEVPDDEEVSCHFAVKSATVTVTQNEPANLLDAKIKLTLPAGTDIRINDKVVWLDNGTEYTAEMPRNIRNHHMFAYVKRAEPQKPI